MSNQLAKSGKQAEPNETLLPNVSTNNNTEPTRLQNGGPLTAQQHSTSSETHTNALVQEQDNNSDNEAMDSDQELEHSALDAEVNGPSSEQAVHNNNNTASNANLLVPLQRRSQRTRRTANRYSPAGTRPLHTRTSKRSTNNNKAVNKQAHMHAQQPNVARVNTAQATDMHANKTQAAQSMSNNNTTAASSDHTNDTANITINDKDTQHVQTGQAKGQSNKHIISKLMQQLNIIIEQCPKVTDEMRHYLDLHSEMHSIDDADVMQQLTNAAKSVEAKYAFMYSTLIRVVHIAQKLQQADYNNAHMYSLVRKATALPTWQPRRQHLPEQLLQTYKSYIKTCKNVRKWYKMQYHTCYVTLNTPLNVSQEITDVSSDSDESTRNAPNSNVHEITSPIRDMLYMSLKQLACKQIDIEHKLMLHAPWNKHSTSTQNIDTFAQNIIQQCNEAVVQFDRIREHVKLANAKIICDAIIHDAMCKAAHYEFSTPINIAIAPEPVQYVYEEFVQARTRLRRVYNSMLLRDNSKRTSNETPIAQFREGDMVEFLPKPGLYPKQYYRQCGEVKWFPLRSTDQGVYMDPLPPITYQQDIKSEHPNYVPPSNPPEMRVNYEGVAEYLTFDHVWKQLPRGWYINYRGRFIRRPTDVKQMDIAPCPRKMRHDIDAMHRKILNQHQSTLLAQSIQTTGSDTSDDESEQQIKDNIESAITAEDQSQQVKQLANMLLLAMIQNKKLYKQAQQHTQGQLHNTTAHNHLNANNSAQMLQTLNEQQVIDDNNTPVSTCTQSNIHAPHKLTTRFDVTMQQLQTAMTSVSAQVQDTNNADNMQSGGDAFVNNNAQQHSYASTSAASASTYEPPPPYSVQSRLPLDYKPLIDMYTPEYKQMLELVPFIPQRAPFDSKQTYQYERDVGKNPQITHFYDQYGQAVFAYRAAVSNKVQFCPIPVMPSKCLTPEMDTFICPYDLASEKAIKKAALTDFGSVLEPEGLYATVTLNELYQLMRSYTKNPNDQKARLIKSIALLGFGNTMQTPTQQTVNYVVYMMRNVNNSVPHQFQSSTEMMQYAQQNNINVANFVQAQNINAQASGPGLRLNAIQHTDESITVVYPNGAVFNITNVMNQSASNEHEVRMIIAPGGTQLQQPTVYTVNNNSTSNNTSPQTSASANNIQSTNANVNANDVLTATNTAASVSASSNSNNNAQVGHWLHAFKKVMPEKWDRPQTSTDTTFKAFMRKIEHAFDNIQCPMNERVKILPQTLQGRALDIWAELPLEVTKTYETLVKALRERLQLEKSEHDLDTELNEARQKHKESVSVFYQRVLPTIELRFPERHYRDQEKRQRDMMNKFWALLRTDITEQVSIRAMSTTLAELANKAGCAENALRENKQVNVPTVNNQQTNQTGRPQFRPFWAGQRSQQPANVMRPRFGGYTPGNYRPNIPFTVRTPQANTQPNNVRMQTQQAQQFQQRTQAFTPMQASTYNANNNTRAQRPPSVCRDCQTPFGRGHRPNCPQNRRQANALQVVYDTSCPDPYANVQGYDMAYINTCTLPDYYYEANTQQWPEQAYEYVQGCNNISEYDPAVYVEQQQYTTDTAQCNETASAEHMLPVQQYTEQPQTYTQMQMIGQPEYADAPTEEQNAPAATASTAVLMSVNTLRLWVKDNNEHIRGLVARSHSPLDWYKLRVGDCSFPAMSDTGSTLNIITHVELKRLQEANQIDLQKQLIEVRAPVETVDKRIMYMDGLIDLPVACGTIAAQYTPFYTSPYVRRTVLGQPGLKALGLKTLNKQNTMPSPQNESTVQVNRTPTLNPATRLPAGTSKQMLLAQPTPQLQQPRQPLATPTNKLLAKNTMQAQQYTTVNYAMQNTHVANITADTQVTDNQNNNAAYVQVQTENVPSSPDMLPADALCPASVNLLQTVTIPPGHCALVPAIVQALPGRKMSRQMHKFKQEVTKDPQGLQRMFVPKQTVHAHATEHIAFEQTLHSPTQKYIALRVENTGPMQHTLLSNTTVGYTEPVFLPESARQLYTSQIMQTSDFLSGLSAKLPQPEGQMLMNTQ